MTVTVRDTGGGADFEPVPEGVHQAVCTAVVDLGVQQTTGPYAKRVHQIWLRWEIPAHRVEWEQDGKKMEGPMVIGNFYTASLSQKATLRKHLEAWRNKQFTTDELEGFDVTAVVGACCQLQVAHNVKQDRTYANVIAIVGWPAGLARIKAEGELLTYGSDDTVHFSKLPKFIQERIQAGTSPSTPVPGAPEPPPPAGPPHHPGDFDDDIPF